MKMMEGIMKSIHKENRAPSWPGVWVGALSYTLKVCRFDSRSGHIPRLQVQSLVGACMGGNQLVVLFLSPFLSLSKTNKHILRWELKKRKEKKRGPTGEVMGNHSRLQHSWPFMYYLAVPHFFSSFFFCYLTSCRPIIFKLLQLYLLLKLSQQIMQSQVHLLG